MRLMSYVHPDLTRCLGCEPRKAWSRQQADRTVGHAFRSLYQSVVLGHPAAVGHVESSSYLPHESAIFRRRRYSPGIPTRSSSRGRNTPAFLTMSATSFCLGNRLQYVFAICRHINTSDNTS